MEDCQAQLIAFADKAGQVTGTWQGLSAEDQIEAQLDLMVAEAVKTSAIEGEMVSRPDVSSSIRNQLGLNVTPVSVHDLAAQGIAELMVAVRRDWQAELDCPTLFAWHTLLMKGARALTVGQWRTHAEPMQVVSGPIGHQRVHFEAPPSAAVHAEMERFVRWFNDSARAIPHGPVRAALAHLYFESIHPFEDGNGRIGRAIAEKALSQGLGRPALLSLSRTIEADKGAYYAALKQAQRTLEVTPWVAYFVHVCVDAQTTAQQRVEFVLRKARFFDRHQDALNPRQRKVIQRMLEEGPDAFVGGMNARKYVALTHVSKATATRDLQQLVDLGVFVPSGQGRSVRYELEV